MKRNELVQLGRNALLSSEQNVKDYERLAQGVLDLYHSGDVQFRKHVQNRARQAAIATGVAFDADRFDIGMARAFVADELGFAGWPALLAAVRDVADRAKPIAFEFVKAAMRRGDFTSFEEMIGPGEFNETIFEWFEKGYFDGENETLDEILSAACMLGQTETAEFLLDKGVDPYAGMRTGLAGPHYAASSGRLDVIKMLTRRGVPLEVENSYGGTVLGQALWSAVNEPRPDHAEIVEVLILSGANVWPETAEWWSKQAVPDAETKRRVSDVLRQHDEFHARLNEAKRGADEAESTGDKRVIADSLKTLAGIMRRAPFLRDAANTAYERAAELYDELGLPLERAWVLRHIGINHEYAGRLEEAERYYDEALTLYRQNSTDDDGNYANAVRYPAVIKERLGKKDEAAKLWEEACERYSRVGPNGLGEGVAEAAAWLTILALERDDRREAERWFARANEASEASSDADTHKFIDDVRQRLEA